MGIFTKPTSIRSLRWTNINPLLKVSLKVPLKTNHRIPVSAPVSSLAHLEFQKFFSLPSYRKTFHAPFKHLPRRDVCIVHAMKSLSSSQINTKIAKQKNTPPNPPEWRLIHGAPPMWKDYLCTTELATGAHWLNSAVLTMFISPPLLLHLTPHCQSLHCLFALTHQLHRS